MMVPDRHVLLGVAAYGSAVARALHSRGHHVDLVDDRPSDAARSLAADLGVPLHSDLTEDEWRAALGGTDWFLPSPGIPESHVSFRVARELEVPVRSEFDLAQAWDDRPRALITGTDGKTSVTMLVQAMLEASGVRAAAVGNTETPLVAAIDDPAWDVFVVEASSFRLGHTGHMDAKAVAWLNFGPDHLDVHEDLAAYEQAKAQIFDMVVADGRAVVVRGEPVPVRHLPTGVRSLQVGLDPDSSAGVVGGMLMLDGQQLVAVEELPRQFDHDITNTLVAAALALELGGSVDGVRDAARNHRVLPHRMELVAELDGVRWWNDSKATVPHAVVTAVRALDSVVLIAGGRNKDLDLGELSPVLDTTRAVVAIGEAAPELVEALGETVVVAESMADAVDRARHLAQVGDDVLLSPGCASFDWYSTYAERGDDFRRCVHALLEANT